MADIGAEDVPLESLLDREDDDNPLASGGNPLLDSNIVQSTMERHLKALNNGELQWWISNVEISSKSS